jgi:hypothetical protein
VLRTIFRPKREVIRRWRQLHDEEFHSLYSSPSIIRMIKSSKIRWAGHVTQMGTKCNACRILVVKPEGMSRGWMDNIKMDLREIGCGWYGLD